MADDVVLEVRNLSRSFGGLKAVQNVSFKLRRNEILGIIGPNGAGKTTVFNLLNGFLRPGTGEILIDGRDMSGRKPHQLCEAGVGRTFQIMRRSRACRSRTTSWSAPMSGPGPKPRHDNWLRRQLPMSACPISRIASPANSRPRNCG